MNTPQSLRQSINFQVGSIVSQELLNKSSGTITLFAFDKGQSLSEHTAPYDALVQVIEGAAKVTISGVVNVVNVDESILMPANAPHALTAIEPFKMILTMIK